MNWSNRQRIKAVVFVFAFALMIWRVIFVPLEESKRGRSSMRGDAYSDINTMSAARYFYDYGFTKSCGLPVHAYPGEDGGPHNAYTHYPAFPDIMAGAYAVTLDTTDDRWLRLFPLLWSVLWFLLIFKVLDVMLPDKRAAFLGALVLVLSNYFLAWGDNLHKHQWEELFKWLYVLLLFRYHEGGAKSGWLLLGMSLTFIFAANASFEPVVFLAVATVGFSIVYRKGILHWGTIIPALAALIGLGLHLWQNACYFGSWDAVWADMESAFLMRTANILPEDVVAHEKVITVIDYLKLPLDLLNRIERFFLIPGWALLVFGWLSLRYFRSRHPRLSGLVVTLLLASVAWMIVMPQHTIVHPFVTKQFGIVYGLIIGVGLIQWWSYAQEHLRQRHPYWMAFHAGLGLYILVMAFSQQVFDLYIRYGFAYPALGT